MQALAPDDDTIAELLERIRSELQAIADQHGFRDADDQVQAMHPLGVTTDASGDLTREKLTLLQWDSHRIDQVIATLNDAVVYRTELDSLPEGIVFPSDLQDKIAFDEDAGELSFSGVMLSSQLHVLQHLAPLGDRSYQTAILDLFESPRRYLARNLRAFSVPDFSTALEALPDGFVIPPNLSEKLYFEESADADLPNRLRFRGIMTQDERDQLLELADDDAFKTAVEVLFKTPWNPPASGPEQWPRSDEDLFFDPAELEALIGDDVKAASPPERFRSLLKRLLSYLRTTLSRAQIIQHVADDLGFETRICARLLTDWLLGRDAHHDNAIDAFMDPRFAESSPILPITRDAFPAQFNTCVLLDKVATVVTRLELSLTQLGWLFELTHTPWPDLNDFPFDVSQPSADLESWKHLWSLHRLCDDLDLGEDQLGEFFALVHGVADDASDAEKNAVKERVFNDVLISGLGWRTEDLEILLGTSDAHTNTGVLAAVFPDDYRGEELLMRLQACFRALKHLGVSAAFCTELCTPLHPTDEPWHGRAMANHIVQTVQAKYEPGRWLDVAAPLRDELRELQRGALVAYLTSRRTPDKPWRDENDLYAHFLIDPEMSPCMMTSRIKLAHGVVQLFVQRCRMNLEPAVAANDVADDGWRQWRWMKNYRVWEANRKIFLYPENWIEPELRDDKSPFFEELESELMQSDVTLQSASEAMLSYLKKLDEVAHLEIVAQCRQSGEYLESGNRTPDVLHVLGRTRAKPNVYYYRRRIGGSRWTPWEQVDLDIEGDHLIPIVWNRRLYLFWPVFTEKSKGEVQRDTTKVTDLQMNEVIPERGWETKLAWSEYQGGSWTAKQTSSNSIPDGPPPENVYFRVTGELAEPRIIHLFDRARTGRTATLFLLEGDLVQYTEELNNQQLSQELRDEFASKGHPLPQDAAIRVDEPSRVWSVYFGTYEYKLNAFVNHWYDIEVRAAADRAFVLREPGADPMVRLRIQPFVREVTGTAWFRTFLAEEEDSTGELFLPTFSPTPSEAAGLATTPGQFFLTLSPDEEDLSRNPFFYADERRNFPCGASSAGDTDRRRGGGCRSTGKRSGDDGLADSCG